MNKTARISTCEILQKILQTHSNARATILLPRYLTEYHLLTWHGAKSENQSRLCDGRLRSKRCVAPPLANAILRSPSPKKCPITGQIGHTRHMMSHGSLGFQKVSDRGGTIINRHDHQFFPAGSIIINRGHCVQDLKGL